MSLNYELKIHTRIYKLIPYNPKTKAYGAATHLEIDKRIHSVPFNLLMADLDMSENNYTRKLEQRFLKRIYNNYHFQQRNKNQLNGLRDYKNGSYRSGKKFSNL